jgi:hypothetical protein
VVFNETHLSNRDEIHKHQTIQPTDTIQYNTKINFSFNPFDYIYLSLFGSQSSQTSNGTANSDTTGCGQSVSSPSDSLFAGTAVPDSSASSLNRVLSAENTTVGGVLRDFHLSDNLTESGTISGSVLSGDSYLLGALSHFKLFKKTK